MAAATCMKGGEERTSNVASFDRRRRINPERKRKAVNKVRTGASLVITKSEKMVRNEKRSASTEKAQAEMLTGACQMRPSIF